MSIEDFAGDTPADFARKQQDGLVQGLDHLQYLRFYQPPLGSSGYDVLMASFDLGQLPHRPSGEGVRPAKRQPQRVCSGKSASAESDRRLIGAIDAARLCGVGRRLWYDMKNAGRIPLPIRLGRRVLWDTHEMERWMDAGCLPLNQWQRVKDQNKRTGSGSKR